MYNKNQQAVAKLADQVFVRSFLQSFIIWSINYFIYFLIAVYSGFYQQY
jgi:hypothetical protein